MNNFRRTESPKLGYFDPGWELRFHSHVTCAKGIWLRRPDPLFNFLSMHGHASAQPSASLWAEDLVLRNMSEIRAGMLIYGARNRWCVWQTSHKIGPAYYCMTFCPRNGLLCGLVPRRRALTCGIAWHVTTPEIYLEGFVSSHLGLRAEANVANACCAGSQTSNIVWIFLPLPSERLFRTLRRSTRNRFHVWRTLSNIPRICVGTLQFLMYLQFNPLESFSVRKPWFNTN